MNQHKRFKISHFTETRIFIAKVFKKAEELGKFNLKYLSEKLAYSKKQIKRLMNNYLSGNYELEHKNKYKTNSKTKTKEFNTKIIDKYTSIIEKINYSRNTQKENKSRYFLPHKLFYEEYIKDDLKVSYDYVNRLLNNNFLITNLTKRKTKRKLKKKYKEELSQTFLNQSLSEELKNYYKNILFNPTDKISFIEFQKSKKIPYVNKQYDFGQCVELDACQHWWFNDQKYYLYHAIDSGTKKLLSIHMEKEETNRGYAILLEKLFKNYGIPIEIKTDKRTTFWNSNSVTNITYCLNELGIKVSSDSEPTFKPNVEGSFRLAQYLYPHICYKLGINSYAKFLENIDLIMNIYNEQFKRSEINKTNQFLKFSEKQITNSLFFKKECKVHRGFYIFFENKKYGLFSSKNKRVLMKSKVVIKKDLLTDELFTQTNQDKYFFRELSDNQIDNYLNEIEDNEWAKIEREKRKNKAINKSIQIKLNKTRLFLEERKQYLEKLIKENENKKMVLNNQIIQNKL